MRKHIPHPITQLYSPYAELDILFGGDETSAMEESMKIACDLRDVLLDGENILFVNTLVSPLRMAHAMGKRFDHGARRGRNLFVTYSSGEVIDKLAVIRYMCEQKGIKYLVITNFELATMNTRHRSLFMGWLRVMRNAGVNIILFTVSKPGEYGTLGSLRYSARSIAAVGAYITRSSDEGSTSFEENEEADIEAYLEADGLADTGFANVRDVHQEEVPACEGLRVVDADEKQAEFEDAPSATMLYRELQSALVSDHDNTSVTQHSDSESLKTKDLAFENV